MSFQTHKSFVRLWNTNEDIFDAFRQLSDSSIDRNVINMTNVQKRSKEIGKIIHVTSGVQHRQHRKAYVVCVQWIFSKMALGWRGGDKLLKSFFFFLCV